MLPVFRLAPQDSEIALQKWTVGEDTEIVVAKSKNNTEPKGAEGWPRLMHEVRQLDGLQCGREAPLGLPNLMFHQGDITGHFEDALRAAGVEITPVECIEYPAHDHVQGAIPSAFSALGRGWPLAHTDLHCKSRDCRQRTTRRKDHRR